jgi:diguanylate cyclase (GGDEF)-like protein
VEELESRLEEADDNQRAGILNGLAALVTESNPDHGARLSREALEISRVTGNAEQEAAAHFGLGDAGRVTGDYRSALEHYSMAFDLFGSQGNSLQKGRCLRRLGDVHYFVTNLDHSLRYYLRALRIFEQIAEKEGTASARLQAGHLLATVGNVLKASGDENGALEYYRRSHSVYVKEGFLEGIPGVLHNMGDALQKKGRLDEAQEVYRQVLSDARERNDEYLCSIALNSLGSVCLQKNEFEEADMLFQRSLETSIGTGRKRGILTSLMKQVELRRLQGLNQEALEISHRAEALALELNDRGAQSGILHEKASLLHSLGDLEEAFTTASRQKKLHEEVMAEKRVRQIDVLRLRYETEAKEREIERLRRDRAVQRIMIFGAAAGLLLAGISLSSVYRSVRLRTRVNRELSGKNAELAKAYERVEELSRTDELTGLANRRAMVERLTSEQSRSARNGRGFGLILGDIDNFKAWNDRFGHECGDAILVELSTRLRKALREQDLASRWGGEEFLILLPDTCPEGCTRVAEKLRELICGKPFVWKGCMIDLTMTFGACMGGHAPIDEALRVADSALYKGKHKGRNRVETAG